MNGRGEPVSCHKPAALASYRPFVSYDELGSMLDVPSSRLYDASARILGITAVPTQEAIDTAAHQRGWTVRGRHLQVVQRRGARSVRWRPGAVRSLRREAVALAGEPLTRARISAARASDTICAVFSLVHGMRVVAEGACWPLGDDLELQAGGRAASTRRRCRGPDSGTPSESGSLVWMDPALGTMT
jgi:hypothetical protein